MSETMKDNLALVAVWLIFGYLAVSLFFVSAIVVRILGPKVTSLIHTVVGTWQSIAGIGG